MCTLQKNRPDLTGLGNISYQKRRNDYLLYHISTTTRFKVRRIRENGYTAYWKITLWSTYNPSNLSNFIIVFIGWGLECRRKSLWKKGFWHFVVSCSHHQTRASSVSYHAYLKFFFIWFICCKEADRLKKKSNFGLNLWMYFIKLEL